MKILFDVEADNLLQDVTQIWCVVTKILENPVEPYQKDDIIIFVPKTYVDSFDLSKLNLKASEKVVCLPLEESKEVFFPLVTSWVGHNAINYDTRVLEKILKVNPIPVKQIEDTMIYSQITQPNRQGGHSLKSWGMRFEDFKGDWTDFSVFDWGMVDYCLQDLRVTEKLYKYMLNNTKGFSKFSVRVEHMIRRILDEMQDNGFAFDEERAHKLYAEIKDKCTKMEDAIKKDFPPEKVYYKKLYPRLTAKGVMHAVDKRTLENCHWDKEVDEFGVDYYHLYTMEEFNPRSTTQIVERMNKLGWKPVVFNDPTAKKLEEARTKGIDEADVKGSPQVCEENFKTLPEEAPESAKNLAQWFLYDKRLQKFDEWFRELNPKTGCIHGKVFGCGAHTHRMTHRNPNTANISKVATKKVKNEQGVEDEILVWGVEGDYSTDMRACFVTRDKLKRRLVGVDLAGIQLRAFAHYANDKEYTEQILSGDIHSHNREILKKLAAQAIETLGLKPEDVVFLTKDPKGQRNISKTFIYGYLFGAGNKKVGEILGFPELMQMDGGKLIKEGFVKSISGLDQFKKNIRKWVKQGYMVALDGRLINLPSEHIALSVALQSFEAVVMKYAMILSYKKFKEENLDALFVSVVHDELQMDVKLEQCQRVIEIVVESMEEAGRFFKSNVPITGEGHIGLSWADSH
jgi:DNA polymerase I-like protein with 3'-5' exonuclease and polymerase domains